MEFIDSGPFLVTGTDFQHNSINWHTCYHVTDLRFLEAPEIHLRNDDLLITKDGTIGKLAIVQNCPEKAVLNSGIFVCRCMNQDYITRYLLYVLCSNVFSHFYELESGGSTIKHLYQETFENFAFPSSRFG
jgi:type I restriction enzyme S subunit